MAEALELPRPTLGQFVSVRLSPWTSGDPEPSVEIAGQRWRRARPPEPPIEAPLLPAQTKAGE
jgi:hypothetical protein